MQKTEKKTENCLYPNALMHIWNKMMLMIKSLLYIAS